MNKNRTHSEAFNTVFQQSSLWNKCLLFLASWFGLGLVPRAPGTAGSFIGILIALFFNQYRMIAAGLWLLAFIILAFFIADRAAKILGREDPREIVIDETAGMWLTLFYLPFSWLNVILGFILFRLFDIIKPFPINRMEKIKGGFGIVLDDLVAGVAANLILQIIALFK